MRTWILTLVAAGLLPRPADATTIVVLDFGGQRGADVRSSVVTPLTNRYEVLDGEAIRAAGKELGVQLTRGPNLARAALHIGAVAVIAGSVSGKQLSLAVFSGETGEVVNTGRIPCQSRLGPRALRQALKVVLKGLRKCPKDSAPTPAPAPAPDPVEPAPMEPAPVVADPPSTPDPIMYEPNSQVDAAENPLEPTVRAKGAVATQVPGVAVTSPETTVVKKPEPAPESTDPRVLAAVGMGVWSRSLRINDVDTAYSPNPPEYDSNMALALVVDFKVRPLALIKDEGFLAGPFVKLRFQTMLGLKSQTPTMDASGMAQQPEALGTSLWELYFEGGYDWNILDSPTSPHLELGFGYGMMNFSIDWGGTTNRNVPDAAYRFLLGSLGARIPFASFIGAHARFDYRIVTSTGEIEADWYGPSSTGGINVLGGLNLTYRGFIARAEYSYTRYFYAFEEGLSRAQECREQGGTCQLAAGGALDVLHGFTGSVGYSF